MNGGTNTVAGLLALIQDQFVESRGDRVNVQNVAVVITDGDPSVSSSTSLVDAGQAVRQLNVDTYAIGVSDRVSETTLQRIVAISGTDRYWTTTDFVSLNNLLDELVITGCQPINDPQPGTLFCYIGIATIP